MTMSTSPMSSYSYTSHHYNATSEAEHLMSPCRLEYNVVRWKNKRHAHGTPTLQETRLNIVRKQIACAFESGNSNCHIDLSSLSLHELPDDVAELGLLTCVRLPDDKNCVQPVVMHTCIQLFLSQNQLLNVPKQVMVLSNLTVLSLRNNLIKTLPSNIRYWGSNLVELNISNNCLTSLPAEILLLSKLRTLIAKPNRFDECVEVFASKEKYQPCKLPTLRELCSRSIVRLATSKEKCDCSTLKTYRFVEFIEGRICSYCLRSTKSSLQALSPTTSRRTIRSSWSLAEDLYEDTWFLPSDVPEYLRTFTSCFACEQPQFDCTLDEHAVVDFLGNASLPIVAKLCSNTCRRLTQTEYGVGFSNLLSNTQ